MKKPKEEEPKKPRRRIKKVRHHGGHHGGAWKVAYADFVTAMMALFLVLWLVSQADTKLKEAIANYFRSPGVFDTMNGGILSGAKKVSKEPANLSSKDEEQALFSVAQSLQKKFETRPEFSKYKDQIRIEVTDEGLNIDILDKAERVSFPIGSAELTEEAKAVLIEIAKGICSLPNPIVIGGHTDSRVFPSETGYTNWELSADRANAARRVLQADCVAPRQIHRIIGHADSQPLVPADPLAPANRRISVTVLRTVVMEDKKDSEGNNDKEQPRANVQPETNDPSPTVSISSDNSTKTNSDEAREAEKKLERQGTMSVGEPDSLPDAPKVKEKP